MSGSAKMGKKRGKDDPDESRKKSSASTSSSSSRRNAIKVPLSDYFANKELKTQFSEAFKGKTCFKDEDSGSFVDANPYLHCLLPNLIKEDSFLETLAEELKDLNYFSKNNDLYKFQQSNDLKLARSPYISGLRNLIYGDLLEWVKQVTGIELNDTVDMNAARYEYTDVLLCHDDELEGRRVAYIFYLVPPSWQTDYGGSLDLFDRDEHGQPSKIAKSLVPLCNNFVFFEVTPESYHQVAEVLTEDKIRVSISGWFHGPSLPRPPRYVDPLPELVPAGYVEEKLVYEWVNPRYLDVPNQMNMKAQFEENSEIQLPDFFLEEKYMALCEAVRGTELQWMLKGPANIRHYELCECSSNNSQLPSVLREALKLMLSEAMFFTLSNITGLSLHELAINSDSSDEEEDEPDERENGAIGDKQNGKVKNPRCYCEVRRWRRGSYTLVHDDSREQTEYALDAYIHILSEGYLPEYGGFVTYLAKGEDEELLTICPSANTLALVYREKDTVRFVKHVNDRIKELSPHPEIHDISISYYE